MKTRFDDFCGGGLADMRTRLGWQLIDHFGIIAGTRGKEDSAGRATFDLQEPKEAVARAFSIVDAFIEEASRADGFRPGFTFLEGAMISAARDSYKYARGDEKSAYAKILAGAERRCQGGIWAPEAEPVAVEETEEEVEGG